MSSNYPMLDKTEYKILRETRGLNKTAADHCQRRIRILILQSEGIQIVMSLSGRENSQNFMSDSDDNIDVTGDEETSNHGDNFKHGKTKRSVKRKTSYTLKGLTDHEIQELRSKINSRERKRMNDLNHALEGLREVMPYVQGPSVRKLSKIATLTLARNYISMLNKSLEEMKKLLDDIYRSGAQRRPVSLPPYPSTRGIQQVGSPANGTLGFTFHNPRTTIGQGHGFAAECSSSACSCSSYPARYSPDLVMPLHRGRAAGTSSMLDSLVRFDKTIDSTNGYHHAL